MGDRARVQYSPVRDIYLGMWPATPVNSAWPSLRGRRNEYQPKGGDALQLGSKGRYRQTRVWVAGKTRCDPLVTHGPYLRALEMQHYKALYKFTLLCFTLLIYPRLLLRVESGTSVNLFMSSDIRKSASQNHTNATAEPPPGSCS